MDDVERAFREAYGPAVATLIRAYGDITLAEDAVQDAFVTAMDRWPRDGVPDNPAGWIVTTARNRAVDVVRRNRRGRELAERLASGVVGDDPEVFEPMSDDQLRLVFTCCHPALRVEHQVALTLRLVAGLTAPQVAAAFLVSEETMAKRLVRAKYKIKAARIPYRVPGDADLPDRLRAVLSVLYLVYNAGADDRARPDLRAEAIRLTRLVAVLMPDEPEVVGLLALMLLSEARMPARGAVDEVVLLRDQDRSRWDRSLIAEGQTLVLGCLRRRRLGPYQLQAAIQAMHCAASRYEDTDWAAIVRFYDRLSAVMPTSVVALNRAIAIAETEGPETGLLLLDDLAADLADYDLFHAARGSMLERLGRQEEAAEAYTRAAGLARSEYAARFLRERSETSVLLGEAVEPGGPGAEVSGGGGEGGESFRGGAAVCGISGDEAGTALLGLDAAAGLIAGGTAVWSAFDPGTPGRTPAPLWFPPPETIRPQNDSVTPTPTPDDHGGDRTRTPEKTTEPGDDKTTTRTTEPGDDRTSSGRSTTEPGDDKGGDRSGKSDDDNPGHG